MGEFLPWSIIATAESDKLRQEYERALAEVGEER
jgi:hypothetical protein